MVSEAGVTLRAPADNPSSWGSTSVKEGVWGHIPVATKEGKHLDL